MAKTKREERLSPEEQVETEVNTTEERPADNGAEDSFNTEPEFETVANGASFKEFEEGEVFTCINTGEKSIRQKQGKKEDQVVGSVMGYVVEERGTGKSYILGNTKAIADAFKDSVKGDIFRLTFQGKVALDGGHTFNSFKIEKAKKPS